MNIENVAPMLDIGVAVNHEDKMYQIQLYGSSITDTADTVVAVLPPQRLEEILRLIQVYAKQGYKPVGEGTLYPDVRLPCQAEQVLEKWR